MKLEHFLRLYTKNKLKWIKDLNVKPETINLLEENIGRTLSDINYSRTLYDPPPRVMEIKAKINISGEYQTDERAGVAWLRWRVSGR